MSVKPSRSFTWQPRFRIWERENTKDNTHFCHSDWQFQMCETKSVSFYICIRTDITMPVPPTQKNPNKDVRLINIANAVRCISLLCNITISSLFSFPLGWVSFLLSHGGAPVILHYCLSSLSPFAPRSLLYAAILRVGRTVCISVCSP